MISFCPCVSSDGSVTPIHMYVSLTATSPGPSARIPANRMFTLTLTIRCRYRLPSFCHMGYPMLSDDPATSLIGGFHGRRKPPPGDRHRSGVDIPPDRPPPRAGGRDQRGAAAAAGV